jgi:hypothetical protein
MQKQVSILVSLRPKGGWNLIETSKIIISKIAWIMETKGIVEFTFTFKL